MGKVVDITEKLSFEDNSKLKIKGVEYEVNSDAPTMLKLMQLMGNGKETTPDEIVTMYELIFSKTERSKLDKLQLQFSDLQTVIKAAMDLVVGDEEPGEQ